MVKNQNHFQSYWKNYVIGILAVLFLGTMFLQTIVSPYESSFSSKGYMANDMAYERAGSSSYYYQEGGFAPEVEDRKVIKNANLNLEADDYDKSKAQTQNSITKYEVLVLSENEYKYKDDYRTINYRLKINSDNLDAFLAEIKTYGEIQNLNVYTNDVTGSYTDYTARLERYNSQIKKYNSMLNDKDITITEEIQIQQRIDQLEDQIFYLQKRVDTIDEEVAYSDVSLNIKEKPSTLSEIDFLGLRDGFKLFMNSLEAGIQFILLLIGFLLPFGIVYGVYRLFRKFKN